MKFNTLLYLKLNTLSIEVMYPNIIKVTYDKSTANTLGSEELKTFHVRSGIQGGPLSPFLFNIVPEVLAGEMRQERATKAL